MFDWLFEKRVRVRVNFITCRINYYRNKKESFEKLEGMLACYEGTAKDKKLYLKRGCTTYEFWKAINFEAGGHDIYADIKDDEIEEGVWIEFNCWESTFNREFKNSLTPGFFNAEIVGDEVL